MSTIESSHISTEITTVIDKTDPNIKKLYNIPLIGSFFKEPKKSKSKLKKSSDGLTGIKMLDNLFVPEKSEDSNSFNYISSAELTDGETVNEAITKMPVFDAYITLFIMLLIVGVTLFAIVFIINQLTK